MANVSVLSTPGLIRRMERATENQNLDDETLELNKRMEKEGKQWHWEYIPGAGHRIYVANR